MLKSSSHVISINLLLCINLKRGDCVDKIKVAIVEDDPVWLSSMVFFINSEPDLTVIATASNKQAAVEMAREHDMDIILMDINLTENNTDGIYAAAEISQFKQVKIIMLTSLESEDIITNSFSAGPINYVSKKNYTDIPGAIRSIYNKTSPMEVLLKEFSRLKEEQLSCLSNAEKEILDLVEKGYSQSKISSILYKSPGTLKSQINKILKKMGVASCKDAIKKIRSKGILK